MYIIVRTPRSFLKGMKVNFDYLPPPTEGEGIRKIKKRGWKYGAGAGLLKRERG